jgi:hypothetical protein
MKVDLKDIASGALQEKFAHSFEKVMENMQDVNTPYKDKRQIVITMTFVQNEQRDNVVADISVKEKLAAQGGLTTQFAVGKDLRSGKVIAEEYGKQLRGQLSIDDSEETIDSETGEIIDIRKVK